MNIFRKTALYIETCGINFLGICLNLNFDKSTVSKIKEAIEFER